MIGAHPAPDIYIVDVYSSKALTCPVCTSVPNNIICGLAIGSSLTYALSPSSPLPESQSTIIDNFFLRLLCIAETEGKYEAMFDIVQGVYASEGAATIISVWGESEVFMRGMWKVFADG